VHSTLDCVVVPKQTLAIGYDHWPFDRIVGSDDSITALRAVIFNLSIECWGNIAMTKCSPSSRVLRDFQLCANNRSQYDRLSMNLLSIDAAATDARVHRFSIN